MPPDDPSADTPAEHAPAEHAPAEKAPAENAPTEKAPAKTAKGEQTRALILETALGLFREHGYRKTTMRRIAKEAGVSLGNAYYYFKSKEYLVQAFYMRTHVEHVDACRELLATETDFEQRLLGVLRIKLRTIEPYHRFSGVLFKTAADPDSPLNPFSTESEPTRAESTALFEDVVQGSRFKPSREMRRELPHLLWTYHMGVVLYWLHDDSEGRRRTYRLVDHTVPLVVQVLKLGSLPLVRSTFRKSFDFLAELRAETAADKAPRG